MSEEVDLEYHSRPVVEAAEAAVQSTTLWYIVVIVIIRVALMWERL